MKIGIPKEIKNNELRVAVTPAIVQDLIQNNHEVFIETHAGEGAQISNQNYEEVGAKIVFTAKEAWEQELILKVKEPQKSEFKYFYEGMILFTYLHLAAQKEVLEKLMEKKVIAFAYETVQIGNKTPLLRPMSEIAGSRSINIAGQFLESINGGNGKLLSNIPGVEKTKVTVIGGGFAGENAAKKAASLGADVSILELNENRIRDLVNILPKNVNVLKSNELNIANCVINSDVVISTVLIPGAKAPKLVKEYMVKKMRVKSLIIDISIDQGGSVETVTGITTHDNPIQVHHGVLHYSVANIPGAVPVTATEALTNATHKYIVSLANLGVGKTINSIPEMNKGLNTINGHCVCDSINVQ